MWKGLIVVLLLMQFTILFTQPIKTNEDIVQQTREFNGECCPCPKNDEKPFTSTARYFQESATTDLTSERVGGDCSIDDTESSPSFLNPSSMRMSEPEISSPVDKKEEPKPLLHPEVDLASSVLETLREATDEEYQEALDRDATRTVAETVESTTVDPSPQESEINFVNVIVSSGSSHSKEEDNISEASHVQEARCIHPLKNNRFNKMSQAKINTSPVLLNEILSLPTQNRGILEGNMLDMDSSGGASNIEQKVISNVNNRLRDLKLKSGSTILNLFPKKTFVEPSELENKFKLHANNEDILTNPKANELSNSINANNIPNIRLNPLLDKLTEQLNNSLVNLFSNVLNKPIIPTVKSHKHNVDKYVKDKTVKVLNISPSPLLKKKSVHDINNGTYTECNGNSGESKISEHHPDIKNSFKNKELKLKSLDQNTTGTIKENSEAKLAERNIINSEVDVTNSKACESTGIKSNGEMSTQPTMKTDKMIHTEILDTLPSPSEIQPLYDLSNDNYYDSNEESNVAETIAQTSSSNQTGTNILDSISNPSENFLNNESCLNKTQLLKPKFNSTTIYKNLPQVLTDSDIDAISDNNVNKNFTVPQNSRELLSAGNDELNINTQDHQFVTSEGKPIVIDVVDDETGLLIQLVIDEDKLDTLYNHINKDDNNELFKQSSSETSHIKEQEKNVNGLSKYESFSESDRVGLLDNNLKFDNSENFKVNVLKKLDLLQKNNQIILDKLRTNKFDINVQQEEKDIECEHLDHDDTFFNHTESAYSLIPTTLEPLNLDTNVSEVTIKRADDISFEDLQEMSDSILDSSLIQERIALPQQCEEYIKSKMPPESSIVEKLQRENHLVNTVVLSNTDENLTSSEALVQERSNNNDSDEGISSSKDNTSNENESDNKEINMDRESSESSDKISEIENKPGPSSLPEKSINNENRQKEMNVEASDFVPNTLPRPFGARKNVNVQPKPISSVTNNNNLFNLNSPLPTLEDIKAKVSQLLGLQKSSANSDEDSINFEENRSYLDSMTDMNNEENRSYLDSMTDSNIEENSSHLDSMTDSNTLNIQTGLPKFKLFDNVNLDIFQLNPMQSNSIIPGFNLNRYKAKLAMPKTLDLKPIKLESSFGNRGKILGASLTFGKNNRNSNRNFKPSFKGKLTKSNIPKKQLLGNSKRTFGESLHLSSLSDNFKIRTEDTARKVEELIDSTKLRNMKSISKPHPKHFKTHNDLHNKLESLHSDLTDRIIAIHDDINHHDLLKLSTIGNPFFKGDKLLPARSRSHNRKNIQSLVSQSMPTEKKRMHKQSSRILDKTKSINTQGSKDTSINQVFDPFLKQKTAFRKLDTPNLKTSSKFKSSQKIPATETFIKNLRTTDKTSSKPSILKIPFKNHDQPFDDNKMLLSSTRKPKTISLPTMKNNKMSALSKSMDTAPNLLNLRIIPKNDSRITSMFDLNVLPSEKVSIKLPMPVRHSKLRTESSNPVYKSLLNENRLRSTGINTENFALKFSPLEMVDPSSSRWKLPLLTETEKITSNPHFLTHTSKRRNDAKVTSMEDIEDIYSSTIEKSLMTTVRPISLSIITPKIANTDKPHNDETIYKPLRTIDTNFQQKHAWPKAIDNSFISTMREATKARLSERKLGRPMTVNSAKLATMENVENIFSSTTKKPLTTGHRISVTTSKPKPPMINFHVANSGTPLNVSYGSLNVKPPLINDGTVSKSLRQSELQQNLAWPKAIDNSLMSTMREAVRARLSGKKLGKPMSIKNAKVATVKNVEDIYPSTTKEQLTAVHPTTTITKKPEPQMMNINIANSGISLNVPNRPTEPKPHLVNDDTVSKSLRHSEFQQGRTRPIIIDDLFLSKIRESVRASLSEKNLDRPMSTKNANESSSIWYPAQSASSNINTAVSVVDDETMKENVTYKCKMVCVKD